MKNHVRIIREGRGLSQTQLATSLGLTQGIISRIEADKQDMTDRQMVELAKCLGVHPVDLIDDPDWSAKPAPRLNEELLRIIGKTVIKQLKQNPTMDENTVAEVMVSLYRRYASGNQMGGSQNKQIEDTADILVSHEISKRH